MTPREGHDGARGVAKIELPSLGCVAEPLRELLAEVDREAHADSATPPDLAAVSATVGAGKRRAPRHSARRESSGAGSY